jgi:hypothetical protein
MASACQKPGKEGLEEMIAPLLPLSEEIVHYKHARRTDWDNHLSMIGESNQAFGWITYVRSNIEHLLTKIN